jgi:acetoin:2,6-dichlorophenolindophenol oxidoreductase subunit alpha
LSFLGEDSLMEESMATKGSSSTVMEQSQQLDLLLRMQRIRLFEEKAEELYILGKIHGTMHLSIGQEASAVGSIAALQPADYILSTHRGHGHCIAKGGKLDLMMAEFLAKETGYCRGRGGSMHIADIEGNNLGANGVVAGGLPISVGVGLGLKMKKSQQVVMCFFGDGAANEGAFHEALNMAAIWDLPIVFVCENNHYGMSMSVERSMPITDISSRASSYAMPGVTVDGNDLFAVFQAAELAVERARRGEGPSLVECKTYRYRGHSKSDQNRYRTRDEIKEWMAKDPIPRFKQYLLENDLATQTTLDQIAQQAKDEIEAAVNFAEESPEPSLDSIEEGVYAP